jgi:hypothetical protein
VAVNTESPEIVCGAFACRIVDVWEEPSTSIIIIIVITIIIIISISSTLKIEADYSLKY